METVILILGTGLLNVLCFFVGSRIGNKVAKGEPIEMPTLNPIEKIHEIKEKHEAREEQNRIDIIMSNIDRYDGTSMGQRDVPR